MGEVDLQADGREVGGKVEWVCVEKSVFGKGAGGVAEKAGTDCDACGDTVDLPALAQSKVAAAVPGAIPLDAGTLSGFNPLKAGTDVCACCCCCGCGSGSCWCAAGADADWGRPEENELEGVCPEARDPKSVAPIDFCGSVGCPKGARDFVVAVGIPKKPFDVPCVDVG